MATAHPTTVLADGTVIPQLGLGVYRTGHGRASRDAVRAALDAGYRHVDTAALYGNEADVGAAIRDSGLRRDEVFVTTKLWNDDQGYDSALRAFDQSLKRLEMDYVDLYLLHWPVPEERLASWRVLERIHKQGRARSIGVSNFLIRHLEELRTAAEVQPAVNQIEVSPFLVQGELRSYCDQRGICVEAYSPLTKGRRLGNSTVVDIATRHDRSPAQVLIRWGLQHGMIVLPKSARPERIRANGDVFSFELTPEDMRSLDGLDEDLHTGWDPTGVP